MKGRGRFIMFFVLAAALAAGLTSCGGGSSSGGGNEETTHLEGETAETAAAMKVLTAFMKARAASDWATECGYASAPALAPLEEMAKENPQYKGKPCPVLLAALAELQPKDVRENNLTGSITVRTEGSKAVALYHGPEGKAYAMPMVKEGGDWKVASLLTEPA
jgi:hypothetical protein